jgi:hypothetical protein
MSANPNSVLFYTAKKPDEAAERLITLANCNKAQQETRRQLAAKYASLYEGLNLGGLAPYGYSTDAAAYFKENNDRIPIIRNAAHSIVDTFVSKIAALETPKPSMMTSHGSWSDRRIAKKLELLVEAEFYEPQGRFATLEELWIHAVRIAAAATGSVAVKVTVYPNEPRVSHEIHDTLTMFFDYGELTYGDMLTMGEITWFDIERLCEIFPGAKNEEMIRRSAQKPPEEFQAPPGSTGHITEMVALYEGWRGSHGGKVGKYCAAVKEGALDFKDYDFPRPPFVWFVIDPHLYGILGHPLTHQVYESVKRDNLILAKVDRGVSKAIRNVTVVDKNKMQDPTALDSTEDDLILDMNDTSAIQQFSAQGFNSAHLDVAERHWLDAHNVSGVPEMHTASKAQPGITAAIADRQVAARLNERFAAVQRRYVQAVAVDDTKLIIQALREVRERGKFTKLWPGKKFLEEVTSDVLDLDDTKYRIRPAATSGRANSPEGRLQLAFELRQMGILSDDGFAAVQSGYDVPEELEDRDTQREWVENEINRWLFAPDEDVAKPDFYRSPNKFMDLESMVVRVVDGLLEAQIEGLEEDRQEFFMMFLADTDAALQQKAATGVPPAAALPPGGGIQLPPLASAPHLTPPLLPAPAMSGGGRQLPNAAPGIAG